MAGNALLTSLSSSALPITALISGPLLARVLGPEQRGEMNAVLAPLFVTMFVASVALPEATTYAVAHLKVPVRRAAFTAAPLQLVGGLLAAVALYFAAPIIERGTPQVIPTLREALPALPLLMFVVMQRFAMSGDRRYGMTSVERTTAAFGRLALLVGLAGAGYLTSKTAVWCNLGANLLAALVLFVPLVRSRPRPGASTLAGRPLAANLAKFGLRGWGGVFANLVNWRLDQAILPAFVGAANLGYYAVAVSLAELPSALLGATKSVVFTEAAMRKDLRVVARAARVILAAAILVDVAIALAAPYVVRLFFGDPFAPATQLARILLLGNIPFVTELILAAGLLSLGRPGLRSVGQVVAAGFTVVGLIFFVPIFGTRGAALTSVSAYTVNFLLTLTFFCRMSGLSPAVCLVPRISDVRWVAEFARKIARRKGRSLPVSTRGGS
ncbi:MAG: oligosaccharide flippase family protein [Pseudonocardiales bacterium]